MGIKGTAVATFDNNVPILLQGEWDVNVAIPAFFAYGQGDGSPGSGFIGADKGTAQDVSGNFNFVVDTSGELIEGIIRKGLYSFFSIDWPLGDPAQGANKAHASACTFTSLKFAVNNPEGKFIITGSMKAGRLTGPAFQAPTA